MKTDAPIDAAFVGKHLLNPTPDPKTVMVPFTPPPLSQAQTWRHAVAFDHCRVLLPQFVFAQHDDVLSQLYQLSLDEGEPRTQPGSFARFWASLVYPFVALRQAWIYYRRTGDFVKQKYGVSTFRQFRDLWYCAWKQNQSPRHYYWRKLYLVPDRRDWLQNLEHRQVNTLLNHLNRHLPIDHVSDKLQFHHHCRSHRLPTVAVLAHWNQHGDLTIPAPAPVAADVFLKPATEYGSVGIMAVGYHAPTHTHRLNGVDYTWPDLLHAIGDLARTDHRRLILQRRLRNAPRNALYGDADICNVRIVTGLMPGGEPEPLGGFIRLPSSMTTTGHDRHIMIASIDVATGRMEPGRFRETKLGDFPLHPDTGAMIENRLLPCWRDMLELAARAHRTYPWMPFIGWDIVDTTDGVLLLEANAYWGGDSMQMPGAEPLGRTRFPEIYLNWFERLHGPRTPARRSASA